MARLTLSRSLSLNDKDAYKKLASNSHETGGDITAKHNWNRRHSSKQSFKRLFSFDERGESVDPRDKENLLTDKSDDVFEDENNADNTTLSVNTTNQSRKRCPGCKICIGIIIIVVAVGIVGICYGISTSINNKDNAAPSRAKSHGAASHAAPSHALLKGPQPEICCLLRQEIGNYSSQSNPLGERCKPDSKFVKHYCQKGVATSKHACKKCQNKQLHVLPMFCFCDVGHQCEGTDRPEDRPEKMTCSQCQEIDTCPCINGGTCYCNKTKGTGIDIQCSCPEGYRGRYCEIILVRLCKKKRGKLPDDLSNCTESHKNVCYVMRSEKEYVCSIITEDSDKAIEDCPDCWSERKKERDKKKEKQTKNERVSKTETQIGVGSRVIGHSYLLLALHIVPQIYISFW